MNILRRLHNAILQSEENARLMERMEEERRIDTRFRTFLASCGDPDERIGNGPTWLMSAARNGSIERVTILLNRGSNIEAQDEETGTPLMHAAEAGAVETVRLLLERDANVNARNDAGQTALMLAYLGPVEVTRLLLEAGADVTLEDCYGTTALSLASSHGSPAVAELLRQYGA